MSLPNIPSPIFAMICLLVTAMCTGETLGEDADHVVPVWTTDMPAWDAPDAPEADTTGPDGRQIAGQAVIRLGNVSTPELHVYQATADKPSDAAVVISPGGGYSILAWDLEGIEVAQWLNSIGVDAIVLKYRVPTRGEDQKWLAPVQDIQRSISLARDGKVPGIAAKKIGVLGFSAGGNASARVLTTKQRHYEASDDSDANPCTPDFGVLVYPAWLVTDDNSIELIEGITVDADTPPTFFAHAIDDRVTCNSSIGLFAAMKRYKIPSSLHIFAAGGHGFGLRKNGSVTDQWPDLCEAWMEQIGLIKR